VSRTLSEEAKGITASIQAGGDTPLATTAGPGASPFILSISERKLETVSGKRAVFFLFFFQAYPAGRLSLAKDR
jgi:hypothetical protein